jgi:hypothetical protein
MDDSTRARTLLIEAHALIAGESKRAASKIGVSLRRKPFPPSPTSVLSPEILAAIAKSVSEMTLSYEPLTPAEERALRRLKPTRSERSALRKLIADACGATLFHFFCLMDAVGDPHVVSCERWSGASFTELKEGPMLHDDFGDARWEFERATERRDVPARKRGRKARDR